METITNVMLVIWGISEIFLLLKMRSGSTDSKGKDEKSLSYLWMVIGISIGLGIFISKAVQMPVYHQKIIQIIGICLLLMGVVFRLIVVNNLGKYFTVDVTIRKDHQLKTDGFYTLVRHPSYSFSILTFVGLAIVLNNYLAAAIVVIPVFLMFSYRIKIEEKVLKDQFGKNYVEYMQRTKKLIPFIY